MLFKKYMIIVETGEVSLKGGEIKDRGMIMMKRRRSIINCKECKLGGGLCSSLITNPRSMRKWLTVSNYCMKYRMRYYVSKEGSNNSDTHKISIF